MQDIQTLLNRSLPTPVEQIYAPLLAERGIQLFIKRDDLIHPEVSGNKWRKLKYNLAEAQRLHLDTILTFGGAWSNHIAATAAACRLAGMKSIGIIRGEELDEEDNPTLRKAKENGMCLEFVSRENYRRKNETDFMWSLQQRFGEFYSVPEGGANAHGVKGCAEILNEVKEHYDVICAPCGTGATIAGMLSVLKPNQMLLGFPALKNAAFLENEIHRLAGGKKELMNNCRIMPGYHFGGYARHTPELLRFTKDFAEHHRLELDFVYTGKMLFGIFDLIRKDFFRQGTKVLAIHTGGLQGNTGIFKTLRKP